MRPATARQDAPGKPLSLFADAPDSQGWRSGPCATTLDLPMVEVWRTYRGRADGENRIQERKADFGLEAFNLRAVGATEAARGGTLLADNLMRRFRQAVLRLPVQHPLATRHGLVLAIGGAWHPDAQQQRLRLSVPRRKRAWFSGLWANAAAPPVIPGLGVS